MASEEPKVARSDMQVPFVKASQKGNAKQVVNLLKKPKDMDVNEVDEETGLTPLHYLVRAPLTEDHVTAVKTLIGLGANVQAVTKHGDTALHLVCMGLNDQSDLEQARAEAAEAAQKEVEEEQTTAPTSNRSEKKKEDGKGEGGEEEEETKVITKERRKKMKKALLKASALAPKCSPNKEFAMEIIKELLDKNVNINAKNRLGRTALHNAAEVCDVAIVRLLLDRGANKNATDDAKMTILDYSYTYVSQEQVRDFLEKLRVKKERESGCLCN